MASKVASLYAEIGADTSGFKKGASEVKTGMGDLTGAISKGVLLGNAAFSLLEQGIGKIVEVMGDSVRAAAEADAVNVRLGAALKATGRAAEVSAYQLSGMATSLEHISAFDDESIKSAYQVLAQFGNIPTGSINDITKAAMDMTAAMGGDLAGNAEQIGRILETGLIPRTMGFSAALKQQIQAQVKAGDTAGALTTLLDGLNSRFGGQAAAQLETYSGKTQKLKNDWQDLLEVIGKPLLQTGGIIDYFDKGLMAEAQWQEAMNRAYEEGNRNQVQQVERAKQISAAQQELYYRGRGGIAPVQAPQVDTSAIDNYKLQLSSLSMEINGPLGDAYSNFQSKIIALNAELAKEPSRAGKKELQDQIDELTAAYARDTAEIIYNTQAQVINANTSIGDSQKIELLSALGEAYGLVDEKTSALINSSQAEIDLYNAGKISLDTLIEKLQTQGALEEQVMGTQKANTAATLNAANAADEQASAVRRGNSALSGAPEGLASATQGFSGLGGAANTSAMEIHENIKAIQKLDGMVATATVNIVVNGEVPNLASFGATPKGGSRGQTKSAQIKYSGGLLNRAGWTLVGDGPGGQLLPYSELISPEGEVVPHEETQRLIRAGIIKPESAYNPMWSSEGRESFRRAVRDQESTPVLVGAAKPREDTAPTVQIQQTVMEAVKPVEQQTQRIQESTDTQQKIAAVTSGQQIEAGAKNSKEQIEVLQRIEARLNKLATAQDMYSAFKNAGQLSV